MNIETILFATMKTHPYVTLLDTSAIAFGLGECALEIVRNKNQHDPKCLVLYLCF